MKAIAKFKDLLRNEDGQAVVSFVVSNFAQINILHSLDKEKTYSLNINEVKTKRTKRQNDYLWALLSEIDVAINGRPSRDGEMEIYVQALERAGAKTVIISAPVEAEKDLLELFRAVVIMSRYDDRGMKKAMFKCVYGSSHFNTKEMGLLIDTVLDMAEEAGLEMTYWKEVLG